MQKQVSPINVENSKEWMLFCIIGKRIVYALYYPLE